MNPELEQFYGMAVREVKDNNLDDAIMGRAIADAGADKTLRESLYIKYRAEQLYEQWKAKIVEAEADYKAKVKAETKRVKKIQAKKRRPKIIVLVIMIIILIFFVYIERYTWIRFLSS